MSTGRMLRRPTQRHLEKGPAARREWLSLSWLYPPSFGTPQLVAGGDTIVVRGSEEEYKFMLAAERSSRRCFEAWLEACEEVADHRLSAPGLYRGIRLLSWEDGEPIWLHEAPTLDFEPPEGVGSRSFSDVALVRRRLQPKLLLEHQLRNNRQNAEVLAARIGRALLGFHRTSAVADPETAAGWRAYQRARSAEFRAQVRSLIAQTVPGSLLEFVCQELTSCLGRFVAEEQLLLAERAKSGLVADCHGSLLLENIAVEHPRGSIRRPIFFGRPPRRDSARVHDVLSDVACLYLDMLTAGFKRPAAAFLEEYFARAPEAKSDKILRSLVVWNALRRACQFAEECSLEPADEQLRVSRLLADAYRVQLELTAPRLLVIAGDADDRREVVDAVSELLDASHFALSGAPSTHGGQLSSAEEAARRAVGLGNAVVICADHLSRPLLEFSLAFGRRHSLPVTALRLGAAPSPQQDPNWASFEAGNCVYMERSLPLPELCREILSTIQHQ